ncbi:MAG: hypothetical protein KBD00_02730 [Candidatus Peribacteraceae bacterium]|nr:hypothetical protein [Candidatus Peribacteraceae bacterium]
MSISSRVTRVVVGLFLGCILGVVLAGSTGFRWNGGSFTAALGDSYCCDPNGPTCRATEAGALCGGGSFPTLGSCQTSCVKTIYCCDILSGIGQTCRQGFKNLNGSTCQNPAVSFNNMQDCTMACPTNGTGALSSFSSSVTTGDEDLPYCGCDDTSGQVCVPATAS